MRVHAAAPECITTPMAQLNQLNDSGLNASIDTEMKPMSSIPARGQKVVTNMRVRHGDIELDRAMTFDEQHYAAPTQVTSNMMNPVERKYGHIPFDPSTKGNGDGATAFREPIEVPYAGPVGQVAPPPQQTSVDMPSLGSGLPIASGAANFIGNMIKQTMFAPVSSIAGAGASAVDPGVAMVPKDSPDETVQYDVEDDDMFTLFSVKPNKINLGKDISNFNLTPHVNLTIEKFFNTWRHVADITMTDATFFNTYTLTHEDVISSIANTTTGYNYVGKQNPLDTARVITTTQPEGAFLASLLNRSRYRVELMFYLPLTLFERFVMTIFTYPGTINAGPLDILEAYAGYPAHVMEFQSNNWQTVCLPSYFMDLEARVPLLYSSTSPVNTKVVLASPLSNFFETASRSMEVYFRVFDITSFDTRFIGARVNPALPTATVTIPFSTEGDETLEVVGELTKDFWEKDMVVKRGFNSLIAAHQQFHSFAPVTTKQLMTSWRLFWDGVMPNVTSEIYRIWPLFPAAFSAVNSGGLHSPTPMAIFSRYFDFWAGSFDIHIQLPLNNSSYGKFLFCHDVEVENANMLTAEEMKGLYGVIMDMSKAVAATIHIGHKGQHRIKCNTLAHDFNQYGYPLTSSAPNVRFYGEDHTVLNDINSSTTLNGCHGSQFSHGWLISKIITGFSITGTLPAFQILLSVKANKDFRFYHPRVKTPNWNPITSGLTMTKLPTPRGRLLLGETQGDDTPEILTNWQFDAVEDVMMNVARRPHVSIYTPGTIVNVHPSSMPGFADVALFCRGWRGGLKVKFRCILPRGCAGKAKFTVYDNNNLIMWPGSAGSSIANQQINPIFYNTGYTGGTANLTADISESKVISEMMIDLRNNHCFSFHMPYMSNQVYFPPTDAYNLIRFGIDVTALTIQKDGAAPFVPKFALKCTFDNELQFFDIVHPQRIGVPNWGRLGSSFGNPNTPVTCCVPAKWTYSEVNKVLEGKDTTKLVEVIYNNPPPPVGTEGRDAIMALQGLEVKE